MSVALIIVYNHKYVPNIEKAEKIYGSRFSHIFHLMPFYTGTKPNVIPVYECSYYFQGYVAQAKMSIDYAAFDYCFFIGDDLLLNPQLNEQNIESEFSLSPERGFLPELISLYELPKTNTWPRLHEAYYYSVNRKGVEIKAELPGREEAELLLKRHGISFAGGLSNEQVHPRVSFPTNRFNWRQCASYLNWHFLNIKRKLQHKQYRLVYPLVGGYADIFALPGKYMHQFANYCGAFAASDLFVELAIPSAMCFCLGEISLEANLPKKGRPLWTPDEHAELDRFQKDFALLTKDFPANVLYYHPVKLSQWKNL